MTPVKIIFKVFDEVTERQAVTFPSSFFVEIIGIEIIGFANFFLYRVVNELVNANNYSSILFVNALLNFSSFPISCFTNVVQGQKGLVVNNIQHRPVPPRNVVLLVVDIVAGLRGGALHNMCCKFKCHNYLLILFSPLSISSTVGSLPCSSVGSCLCASSYSEIPMGAFVRERA